MSEINWDNCPAGSFLLHILYATQKGLKKTFSHFKWQKYIVKCHLIILAASDQIHYFDVAMGKKILSFSP